MNTNHTNLDAIVDSLAKNGQLLIATALKECVTTAEKSHSNKVGIAAKLIEDLLGACSPLSIFQCYKPGLFGDLEKTCFSARLTNNIENCVSELEVSGRKNSESNEILITFSYKGDTITHIVSLAI